MFSSRNKSKVDSGWLLFRSFFRHLRDSIDVRRATATLGQLLPLLPQTTDNTLVLIVDTLDATLKVVGNALDAPACTLLVKTILGTWFEKPQGKSNGVEVDLEKLPNVDAAYFFST